MSKPTGEQLQLTTASDIQNIDTQLKLARYNQFRQLTRSRLARGNGSFPNYKVDWDCAWRGNVVTSAQAIGIDPISGATTFENEVRSAVSRLSRTKLNNMKRQEGKSSLGPYVE